MNRRKVGWEHQQAKQDMKTQRATWSGSKFGRSPGKKGTKWNTRSS